MCPMKACANLPHPIFFNIFPNFFKKNNTDLIAHVGSSSVGGGSFFMVDFEKVHPNAEEESRKWMIWKSFDDPPKMPFFKFHKKW